MGWSLGGREGGREGGSEGGGGRREEGMQQVMVNSTPAASTVDHTQAGSDVQGWPRRADARSRDSRPKRRRRFGTGSGLACSAAQARTSPAPPRAGLALLAG